MISIISSKEEFVVEKFEGLELEPGKYSLLLKTLYNVDIEDEFRQDFEVKSKMRIWIYGFIGLIALGIVYLIVFMRKRKRKKKVALKKEIEDLGTEIEGNKKRKKGGGGKNEA